MSSSELNLFVQIATSGDSAVAAAIGKRYLLGIEGFKQDYQKAGPRALGPKPLKASRVRGNCFVARPSST